MSEEQPPKKTIKIQPKSVKSYIVYDSNGKILRTGICQNIDFELQKKDGEFIIEGRANDALQKIVDGKIVDKTAEEIEAEKPPEPEPIPYEQQRANITNKQLQEILARLNKLEGK